MSTKLETYGAHLSPNGLWVLIQDIAEQNARRLNIKSGLKVHAYRGAGCPHAVVLPLSGTLSDDASALLGALESDPVGKLLLPSPGKAGQIIYIDSSDVNNVHIQEAMALTSPSHVLPMKYAWMTNEADLKRESKLTNLQPFVVIDVNMRWMKQYGYKAISMFSLGTRPLILVGDRDVILPSEVKRRRGTIFKKIHKAQRSLKEIGAYHLLNWMRNAK